MPTIRSLTRRLDRIEAKRRQQPPVFVWVNHDQDVDAERQAAKARAEGRDVFVIHWRWVTPPLQ